MTSSHDSCYTIHVFLLQYTSIISIDNFLPIDPRSPVTLEWMSSHNTRSLTGTERGFRYRRLHRKVTAPLCREKATSVSNGNRNFRCDWTDLGRKQHQLKYLKRVFIVVTHFCEIGFLLELVTFFFCLSYFSQYRFPNSVSIMAYLHCQTRFRLQTKWLHCRTFYPAWSRIQIPTAGMEGKSEKESGPVNVNKPK